VSVDAGARSDQGVAALLRRPGYGRVVAGSLLWHTNRWASLFAATLLLTQQGASPMGIQVIGALFFAPMLLGAAATSILAVAAPRTTVLVTQLVLLPVQTALVVLVALDGLRTWMIAAAILVVGVGNAVNMTSQRMLVQDAAGVRHAAAALKLEPVLSGIGAMVGAAGTGVLVDHLGTTVALGAIAALDAACVVLTLRTRAPARRRKPADASVPPRVLRMIRDSPGLTSMIGVTLVMNLCVFGYTSLVPKMSEHFTASAAVAGLLAAASGLGQLSGGLVIAVVPVRRRSRVLFAGSGIAAVGVMTVAIAPTPALAFVSLLVAGLGQSGFSAMQSMIAVDLPDGTERTVALGAVSTAVGALPIGMLLIGALSEGLGVRGGLVVAAGAGLILLVVLAAAGRRRPAGVSIVASQN
jgi:predicted MFS family arabinose efflux permease